MAGDPTTELIKQDQQIKYLMEGINEIRRLCTLLADKMSHWAEHTIRLQEEGRANAREHAEIWRIINNLEQRLNTHDQAFETRFNKLEDGMDKRIVDIGSKLGSLNIDHLRTSHNLGWHERIGWILLLCLGIIGGYALQAVIRKGLMN